MDPGRLVAPRTGSRNSPRLSPVQTKQMGLIKGKLDVNTGEVAVLVLDGGHAKADSNTCHTPFPLEKFSHTTYTTFHKGVTYTRYVIREAIPQPAFFQSNYPKSLIMQTTYKTLKQNAQGKNSWFTQIHSWMTEDPLDGSLTVPSSPRRRLHSIAGLQQGQLSPKRFSDVYNI